MCEEENMYLTVFLAPFFIKENISLHIPNELVGKQLRRLRSPQDVLSYITHLQTGPKNALIVQVLYRLQCVMKCRE